MTKRKIEGAPGAEPLCEQRFQRLHQRDHADLVIETAATPHDAVLHDTTERRMCPLVQGVLLDRHHIEVAHEQHRFERGVRSLHVINQAVARHDRARGPFADARIGTLEKVMKVPKHLGIEPVAVVEGHGREGQRLGKPLHGFFFIDPDFSVAGGWFGLVVFEHGERAITHRRRQDDDDKQQGYQCFLHGDPLR